ncbi:SDR family oxidoreductase [Herbiconiux sp. CPCC 205763]|uniref:SDR family oxidoreductase n=1 Tax=Herbiconiux aconitum TaxID=2970913 RepID=A0ABT2GNF4_9MICO|nr:SDR family oxidoreductase [Herbiconiux aconitum]MCS5717723.1 SDR family oxidoreductase [Herbiconiux aconitum]
MELANKTALITGAGAVGGIGAAIARRFAVEGADVVIAGRNQARGDEVVAQITEAGGKARFVLTDLLDEAKILALAEAAGPVDILVNNAAFVEVGPVVGYSSAAFDTTFDTNVRANYILTGALVEKMVARGSGNVINISSLAAKIAMPNMAAYGASKGAVESLTRSYAAEFAANNIRVNAISPGTISSDYVMDLLGPAADQLKEDVPLKRIGKPEEIAEVALFLASDRSSFVTGAVLAADGGRTAV